tara:strand:- start:284 stop:1090 length:807 start_codon:yes stop_codon:yes gene_type:complete
MTEEAISSAGSQDVAESAPAVSFLDSLPEDLRSEPSLRNFTDVGALAKSFTHAQRMVGADKIVKPHASWTDDQWTDHYANTGRPEASSGYEFEQLNAMNDNTLEQFRESAFAAGLSGKQAQKVAEFMDNGLGQMETDRAEQTETLRYEGEQILRQEYGKAYEQKVNQAHSAARQMLGGDAELLETVELSDGRLLGDHPDIIKMFSAFAEQIGEDNLHGDTAEAVMTRGEISQQLGQLMRLDGPYGNGQHPEHDAYVDEVRRLHIMLHD